MSDLGTKTTIFDKQGTDLLNFSQATAAVTMDLGKGGGQPQRIFASNTSTLALKGTLENVIGTPQDDTIKGNVAANRIEGLGGNDRIYGNSGNDILYGGPGNDWLYGDAGSDKLFGGAGNNVLVGGAGNDRLDVLAGADAVGRNLLIGGAGLDNLQGGPGEEILIGGTTRYDGNAAALAVIMQERTSTQSFDERWQNLEAGINNGPELGLVRLLRKTKTNPRGTVLDDELKDVLFGGAASDWFLDFPKDDASNRGDGDH